MHIGTATIKMHWDYSLYMRTPSLLKNRRIQIESSFVNINHYGLQAQQSNNLGTSYVCKCRHYHLVACL